MKDIKKYVLNMHQRIVDIMMHNFKLYPHRRTYTYEGSIYEEPDYENPNNWMIQGGVQSSTELIKRTDWFEEGISKKRFHDILFELTEEYRSFLLKEYVDGKKCPDSQMYVSFGGYLLLYSFMFEFGWSDEFKKNREPVQLGKFLYL